MFFEDFVVFGVAPSAEGIQQCIEVGRDPPGLPLEVEPDMGGGEDARHLQVDLVVSTAVLDEVEVSRGVRLSSDPVIDPGGAPQIAGDNVSKELELRDVEMLEVGRGRAGDIFVIGEVEDTNAG